ncbi:PREDICTED: leukotriene B4 receptor 1-like, partial [Buceros rhinoceros silvestris]|uniref:leukotriene B4 receptor 1-like n=1 Tax=Buceros rhinoceros silvestris TaxID=175836 RepID=UPI0005291455
IFHLAVADVVTLLTGPIYLRALSVGRWNMGLAVCRARNYLCATAMYVSIFLITLLGLHRCLAVSRPTTAVFHNLLETILGWALPLTAMAVGYGLLIRRLRQTQLARRGRTFRLVAAVVIAFAVAWGPYHLASLLEVAVVLQGGSRTLEAAAKATRPPATALAFLSSALNPLLYACAGKGLCHGPSGSFLPQLLEVSAITGSSRGTTAKRTLQG